MQRARGGEAHPPPFLRLDAAAEGSHGKSRKASATILLRTRIGDGEGR